MPQLLKKYLIALSVFCVSAFVTFGAVSTPGALFKSTPYYTIDTTSDAALTKASPSAIALLDGIVAKVKAKAESQPSDQKHNAYIAKYLATVESIEASVKNEAAYSSTYVYIFKYLYPRVHALTRVPSLSFTGPASSAASPLSSATATLQWISTYATKCTANSDNGATWQGEVAASDAGAPKWVSVTPPAGTTTYSLECWNADNVSTGKKNVTVYVASAAPTLSFVGPESSASNPLPAGAIGMFSWDPKNVTKCTGSANNGATGWSGGVNALNASQHPLTPPAGTTTYSLECWNANNVSTGKKDVTVYVAVPTSNVLNQLDGAIGSGN